MTFRPFRSRAARAVVAACAAAAFAAVAAAAQGWHRNLDDGLAAAKKTGKPVFVLTIWPSGVCNACDDWRGRVGKDAGVAKQMERFEAVEWIYDGPDGKVIRWTLDRGGKSDDPSAQCFVVGRDGALVSRLDDSKSFTPAAVSEWLRTQARRIDLDHPRTAVAFVPATVTADGEGAARKFRCDEVDAAREAKRPVLVYVSRYGSGDDRTSKADAAACRKLENGLLDSKACADAAEPFTRIRLEVDEPAEAGYAAALGAERAPALLLWEPGAEKPVKIALTTTAADLAFRLKKAARPADAPK